jgi:hypothetical protein
MVALQKNLEATDGLSFGSYPPEILAASSVVTVTVPTTKKSQELSGVIGKSGADELLRNNELTT